MNNGDPYDPGNWRDGDALPTPRTHTTQPGESVMGIALRQCGNEAEWRHILACNPEFLRMLPHEYFPVGTVLTLPPTNPKSCQTGYADICKAGRIDGVVCPDDSCDIDDGVRKDPAPAAPISHERAFHIALVLEMSELSDRSSPVDAPSAMVADSGEMAGCIERALERTNLALLPTSAASLYNGTSILLPVSIQHAKNMAHVAVSYLQQHDAAPKVDLATASETLREAVLANDVLAVGIVMGLRSLIKPEQLP